MERAGSTDRYDLSGGEVDLDRPNAARMYDYYLGGCHNLAVDREAADAVIAAAPEVVGAAHANRAFLRRVVQFALDTGIRQFLDLGSGIPTAGNVHEIAHAVDPDAHVVYVDVEPVAVTHAQLLLAEHPSAGVVRADLRDTDTILAHPVTRRLIDWSEPLCVLLVSVLHFVPGDVHTPVAALRQRQCPGSLLAISHATHPDPGQAARAASVAQQYARTATPIHHRSPEQVTQLFTGLHLVPPNPYASGPVGLVPVDRWRPEPGDPPGDRRGDSPSPYATFLAGVGRTPAAHPPPPIPEQPPATAQSAQSGQPAVARLPGSATTNQGPVHRRPARTRTPAPPPPGGRSFSPPTSPSTSAGEPTPR